MHFRSGHVYKVIILFVVLWAALAIVAGALNKAGAEPAPQSGVSDSGVEIALKMCAVIFTAVAAAASGFLHKRWRRIPVVYFRMRRLVPVRRTFRYRPPPHGFWLLRQLQIIIV